MRNFVDISLKNVCNIFYDVLNLHNNLKHYIAVNNHGESEPLSLFDLKTILLHIT